MLTRSWPRSALTAALRSKHPQRQAHPVRIQAARLPLAARRVLGTLSSALTQTQIRLQTPEGASLLLGSGPASGVTLHIHDWAVVRATLARGDVGFAESYMAGHWSCTHLTELLGLLIAHRTQLDALFYGTFWGSLLARIAHRLHRNTRRGSRKNIQAHYDLGNPFYRLWLDDTWSYSSAWYEGDFSRPLAQAQEAKYRRLLEQLQVQPGQRVLEIGCGWGGFAELAARERQAKVYGITLSHEQLALGQQRMHDKNLQSQVQLVMQDYRDLCQQFAPGHFDAIASIEMIEAVGMSYWPTYFETLQHCLKPGGRAAIQSIVIRDDLFERYIAGTDFIQQYVFPGGCLPSESALRAQAQRVGLHVIDRHSLQLDYAQTLQTWHAQFLSRIEEVRALGYDQRFERLWRMYLAYCEAAFRAGNIDVLQITFEKPLS